MEIVDVLNEKGEKMGVKPKSQVHKDGDLHRGAHLWIVNTKGEILLQKRSEHVINYPSRWDASAGGHVFAGENSKTAMVRELEEELGVHAQEKDLHPIGAVREQTVVGR